MRYVVVGDIHGDFKALQEGLASVNFNPTTDTLITLGDHFDRGYENIAVYNFLKSLPNKILIRGNHDSFLQECLMTQEISCVDDYNGTSRTIAEFAGVPEPGIKWNLPAIDKVARCGVVEFIRFDLQWYFETKNYIFCHGGVPLDGLANGLNLKALGPWDWYQAACGNTDDFIKLYHLIYPSGGTKKIVFGHWATFLLHEKYDNKENDHSNWIDSTGCLIGLDNTTAISHTIYPLVIEDEPLN